MTSASHAVRAAATSYGSARSGSPVPPGCGQALGSWAAGDDPGPTPPASHEPERDDGRPEHREPAREDEQRGLRHLGEGAAAGERPGPGPERGVAARPGQREPGPHDDADERCRDAREQESGGGPDGSAEDDDEHPDRQHGEAASAGDAPVRADDDRRVADRARDEQGPGRPEDDDRARPDGGVRVEPGAEPAGPQCGDDGGDRRGDDDGPQGGREA